MEKIEKYSKWNNQKSQFTISLWIGENLGSAVLNSCWWIRKLCPNLSFIFENKMGNLHKTGHIPNVTWWISYFISSNSKNLSINWENMFSIGEKWNLEPMGNFAYNTEFLILGKALLILLPFYIILSLICNRVQKYFLQLEHHISLSYQRQLYLQMPLWIPGIYLKL